MKLYGFFFCGLYRFFFLRLNVFWFGMRVSPFIYNVNSATCVTHIYIHIFFLMIW